MPNNLKARIAAIKARLNTSEDTKDDRQDAGTITTPLVKSLGDNMINIRSAFRNSSDFLTRQIKINDVSVVFMMIEGMVNTQVMSKIMLDPLLNQSFKKSGDMNEIYDFIQDKSLLAPDMKDIFSCEEVFQFIMSGFVAILIDGMERGIVFGLQGFQFRSISEPASEINERGSREGFTEPLRINMTMVRRRIKSPFLKFELMTLGSVSKTDICLMYMTDRISPTLLQSVKKKLGDIKFDTILTSGYIQPFLEGSPWSLFSDVGSTERPDVLAAKINEGRIAIIVDGTPYALIAPYFFTENFQSLDDYAHRAYYASFIRILKYTAFLMTILLPSLYVGIGTFHPELLPHSLLFNIAAAEETTPFPLFLEALLIHFLYEVMREAGLRLPRPVGHAVSIVGALVIGDAAVSAGLIGSPMVLIVAMTAISSFVVPSLYEPVSVLRFVFIIIGGTMGLYGIALATAFLLVNVCSLTAMGAPYMAPIAPFSKDAMRDTIIRSRFTKLQKYSMKIQDLNGAKINEGENEDWKTKE